MIVTTFAPALQTAAQYEDLYWVKVGSPANQEIDLASIVKPSHNIFAYAQHCHEATLTLAMALHNTSRGNVCDCFVIRSDYLSKWQKMKSIIGYLFAISTIPGQIGII